MSTAIEKFERKNMAAFETLSFIQGQRKALEQQEKEINEILLQGMKKHGIASIDNDIVRINYIPESESVSLDTKKWRVEDPDSYHKIEQAYNKRTRKSEYIRITVK